MTFFDPDELADIRADRIAMFTDKAWILRPADKTAAAAAGLPAHGLSNGQGGVKTSATPQAPGIPPQYNATTTEPIPAKISTYPRGMGERLNADASQAITGFRLKIPYDVALYPSDRVRVVTGEDDFIAEVSDVLPKTDQFSRSAIIIRVV